MANRLGLGCVAGRGEIRRGVDTDFIPLRQLQRPNPTLDLFVRGICKTDSLLWSHTGGLHPCGSGAKLWMRWLGLPRHRQHRKMPRPGTGEGGLCMMSLGDAFAVCTSVGTATPTLHRRLLGHSAQRGDMPRYGYLAARDVNLSLGPGRALESVGAVQEPSFSLAPAVAPALAPHRFLSVPPGRGVQGLPRPRRCSR